jgi:hypothetical protein
MRHFIAAILFIEVLDVLNGWWSEIGAAVTGWWWLL